MHLNVLSPTRAFISDECLSVSLPGKLGDLQILPGHMPCLIELKAGLVVYENNQRDSKCFMVSEGFVELDGEEISILCEEARHKDEIDRASEEAKLLDIKQQLANLDEQDDHKRLSLSLAIDRCLASLKLLD